VVTSFLFKAHPVSMIYGGPMFWELKDAKRVMQWYRDFLPNPHEGDYRPTPTASLWQSAVAWQSSAHVRGAKKSRHG